MEIRGIICVSIFFIIFCSVMEMTESEQNKQARAKPYLTLLQENGIEKNKAFITACMQRPYTSYYECEQQLIASLAKRTVILGKNLRDTIRTHNLY